MIRLATGEIKHSKIDELELFLLKGTCAGSIASTVNEMNHKSSL